MTKTLSKVLSENKQKEFATEHGNQMHKKLQNIVLDNDIEQGDKDIINQIKKHIELIPLFKKESKTELALAGYIKGKFQSRRIDRILINKDDQIITYLDYKTDTDKTRFLDAYKRQMNEYKELLQQVYPTYKINGYIFWLSDYTLTSFS